MSLFHPWIAQRGVRQLSVVTAEGCWFTDAGGSRYLDLSSQLVNLNLGHGHPRLVDAVVAQARELCTLAPTLASEARTRLAAMIVERSPMPDGKVMFTNGGADAVEHAVRLARLSTGRRKVLAAYRSYHGATGDAIALTGDPRRWPNEPGSPGVVHFFGPHLYRSAFYSETAEQECERALDHLRQVIEFEGPHTVAAVLLEPVVGTNGVLVPPDGYLAGVRELCDEHGILLVSDEVMTGFGRIGEWFAVDHWAVRPDLITFAKGVNSGYVPLGGVVLAADVAATFDDRPYPGGLTYAGHPLACAAGVASIEVFEETQLLKRVRELGVAVAGPALRELADRHPSVGDVRGLGLMWAIELVRDRSTRQPLVPFNPSPADNVPMKRVVDECVAQCVWPFAHMNRIHVVPPLIISEDDLLHGIGVLDRALSIADDHVA